MANNRTIVATEIKTAKPRTILRVSIWHQPYSTGGVNKSTYQLSVHPVEVDEDGRFERTVLGSGGRAMLEMAPRFSQKRLQQLAEAARNPENEALRQIVDKVLARNGLTLASDAASAEELAVACV